MRTPCTSRYLLADPVDWAIVSSQTHMAGGVSQGCAVTSRIAQSCALMFCVCVCVRHRLCWRWLSSESRTQHVPCSDKHRCEAHTA